MAKDEEISFEALQKETDKEFGPGVFGLASRIKQYYTYIPTGIFNLDFALLGGLTESQVHTFVGREQAGKTTAAIRAMKNYQEKYTDGYVLYVDAEGTFDNNWAASLGVDLDRVYMVQPTNGEQAVDIVMSSVSQLPEIGFIVIDSIPALISTVEATSSISDHHIAPRAKLYGKFLNKLGCIITERRLAGNHLTAIMINQWRNKIGVMYGDPRVMPGGDQQRYQNFTCVDFKFGGEKLNQDQHKVEAVESNAHSFTIQKLKGPKFIKTGDFTMIRNEEADLSAGSIDDYKEVIKYAKKYKLLKGKKVYGSDLEFRIEADLRTSLIENPLDYMDLQARIISIKRTQVGLAPLPADDFLIRYHGNGLELPEVDTSDVEDSEEE